MRKLLWLLVVALLMVVAPTAHASEAPGVRPPTTDSVHSGINAANCIVTFEYRGNMYFVKRYVGYSVVNEFNTYSYTLARAKYDEWMRTYGCNGIES